MGGVSRHDMNPVEAEMLAYIQLRHSEGALSVPKAEVLGAVVSSHPEFQRRAAYQHGLDRLERRCLINAVIDRHGARHYFIGNFPSAELRESLGI